MIRMVWNKGAQTFQKMALAIAVVAQCASAIASTEIKIPTPKGFVAFSVEGDWPVLSMQMAPPVASAAFRIPNPADVGTSDSSNIVIALYDSQSAEARTAFKTPVKQYGSTPPKVEVMAGWTIYRQAANQGDTKYTILDAKRTGVVDVSVGVRMIWPHLAANAPDYNMQMDGVFASVLKSIHGGTRP